MIKETADYRFPRLYLKVHTLNLKLTYQKSAKIDDVTG